MEDIKEQYDENLNLVYLNVVKVQSQLIYTSVLLFVLVAAATLPFIKVQISVQGTGIMQSIEEKYELQAPVSGRVNLKFLKDNHTYHKGDTLLIIDSSVPHQQNQLVNARIQELLQLKMDARKLIYSLQSGKQQVLSFATQRYVTEWHQYLSLLQTEKAKFKQAEDNYKRYKELYDHKVVSASEFEKYAYEYENSTLDINTLKTKYQNQWQLEINQYDVDEREQISKQSDLREQQKLYILRAPVSGTLVNLNSTQTGVYVFSGQKLADLSPDTLLTAVCYVKPSDIGLVHKGQNARLQIDAFNYNQWGFSEAKVIDISNDVIINENGQLPLFKVKCSLTKGYLSLKNGYHGNIRKGMTFVARFIVTKRSVFQLLYDKVDNWLNPNVKTT